MAFTYSASSPLAHKQLKERHRALRSDFPQPLTLRVHRALSWYGRAEAEVNDLDVRFILLWIGFNAAYAGDLQQAVEGERNHFGDFFSKLVNLDNTHRIYDAVWQRFPQEIRLLLNNQYIYSPFWRHQNGEAGFSDWEQRLERSRHAINQSLAKHDTPKILTILFDRLYVLRNQLMHGGSTWNSEINRDQVRDGASLIGCLLPVFIDLMMDHPEQDWPMPYYQVVL